jgi:hypothetical protein
MFLCEYGPFKFVFFEARSPNNRTVVSKKRETNGGHLVLGFRRTLMLFVTNQLHKCFIFIRVLVLKKKYIPKLPRKNRAPWLLDSRIMC